MFVLAVVLINIMRVIMFRKHIRWYARGMMEYRCNNWSRSETWNMIIATNDEMKEALNELRLGNIKKFLLEACDVNHGMIQTISLFFLGSIMRNPGIYWLLYILCPFSAWKQGDRYGRYRCVRSLNHHNPDDHVCGGYNEKIMSNKRI